MKKYAALFLILFLCSYAFADNDYFEASTYQITPGSTARSSQINNITNALETGLDKLPSESNIKNGLINYGTDAGAADAYVVTMPYTPTAYTDGMLVAFKAGNANTGACTVNVDSLGAKSIKRQDGSAPIAGDIAANKIVELRYNSTSGYFEIQGSIGATAGAGTMSLQNANAVAITGGTASGLTLTSPVLNGTLSGTAFLDEDDMASNSASAAFSQQSLVSYITSGSVTMASKTLTSPVLNGTLSGTAFLDEDDMASNSAVAAVSQQSLINYLASGSVTFSNKNFSQNGTVTITDTGGTGSENALNVFAPNLSDGGAHRLRFGVSADSYNSGTLSFDYTATGNASNFFALGITGVGDVVKVYGSGNTIISGTAEIADTLTLSKASGTGLSVTADIDFNAIASGATKAEINTTCDGNTATAAEITARCDGVPSYSTDDNAGLVTVTTGGIQVTPLDLGTVTSGDVFYIETKLNYTKGGTSGSSNYLINKASGTATIAFPATAIADTQDDTAATSYNKQLGGICFVTGSGTLVMQVYGYSHASDSSVFAGDCDLAATFIKKQ
jgi:hypothetical protein